MLLAATVSILLLSPRGTAYAHRSQPVDIDTLTRRASIIVEADVADVRAAWTPDGTQIRTKVRLRVRQYLKGGHGEDTLEIEHLGGTIGELTFAVLGQPTFETGERVFLFVAPNVGQGDFPIVAGEHGKFTVETDPRSRAEMLHGPHMSLGKDEVVKSIGQIMAGARGTGHGPRDIER
jgi:hypothetical protein